MPGEAELIFGKLAIQKGYLDETDLTEAIRVQQDLKEVGVAKTVGEILSERGKMTPDQVKTILEAQKHTQMREEDRRYGELAVRNGFCSVADVREALAVQQRAVAKKAPVIPPLGFILRERGKITEQQHEALKQAQARLGKPLNLLESTTPARLAVLKAATAAPTCPICGEKAKKGAVICALCGSSLSADAGRAADVTAAEMLRASVEVESSTFGSIAIKMGFVSEAQLEECLVLQESLKAKGIPKRLGDILVAKSYISPAQLKRIIGVQSDKRGALQLDAAAPVRSHRAAVAPQAAQQAAPVGARFKAFARGKMFGYAATAAGLVFLVALGYFIFASISKRSSSTDKDASGKGEDFSELCRKADLALKNAERTELAQAGSGDFQQILAAYGDVVSAYPDTPAAKKAFARKQELESTYLAADEDFRKAKMAASDASFSGDYDRAFAILDEFIARVSAMNGKPLLQEGKAYLQGTVAGARKDLLRRLNEVGQALAEGKEDVAVERFEKLRNWKLLARCEECKRAFGEWDARLAPIRTKLEERRAAAAANAQRQEDWRKGGPQAVADGKRLAGQSKFAEALLEFRKALLFSGSGPLWTEAAEGLAGTQALLKKTQTDLQSALNFARNWTVSKMYDKAGAKCKDVGENPAFAAFRENFLDAEKELKELEKSKGDHGPLVKKLDALQKTINEWAANQLSVDPSLQCSKCHGVGSPPCETCGGNGAVKGPNCKKCEGSGKVRCAQCEGVGAKPCVGCNGTGSIEKWEDKKLKCEACGGKGKIWADKKCTECEGKGTIKKKVKTGPLPCEACAGQKRIVCKNCEKGLVACPDCKGRGYNDVPCADCSGKGSRPCARCSGSGLAAEKF